MPKNVITQNIIHTKLGHYCILKCELFKYDIVESPYVHVKRLTTHHYFFSCSKYAEAIDELFNNVFSIGDLNIVNTHFLLQGELRNTVNDYLFSLVHIFIKKFKKQLIAYLHVYQNVLIKTFFILFWIFISYDISYWIHVRNLFVNYFKERANKVIELVPNSNVIILQ